MRILEICAYTWSIGGPARVVHDYAAAAIKSGHSVTILSPISDGENIYSLPEGVRLITCKRTKPFSFVLAEFSIELYQYLKRHIQEYDIVHCHGLFNFANIAPFLFKNNTLKVVTIHGLLDKWALANSKWKKGLFSFITKNNYLKSANLIHVFNREEQDDLNNYLGFVHKGVVVIPNGIKIQDLSNSQGVSFREQFGIRSDKKIVLFMSRLDLKKGIDLLLPAFKKYNQKYNDGVLVVAGPDYGYQKNIEQFISENNLEADIKLVGMLTGETKQSALCEATIFALTSRSEGFSIAVLEAIAAQTPILVSDRVGFDGMIRQYDAGCEVELDAESIFEGLERLLQHNNYRNKLKQNATQMLTELYDIEIVTQKALACFEQVLHQQKTIKRYA